MPCPDYLVGEERAASAPMRRCRTRLVCLPLLAHVSTNVYPIVAKQGVELAILIALCICHSGTLEAAVKYSWSTWSYVVAARVHHIAKCLGKPLVQPLGLM